MNEKKTANSTTNKKPWTAPAIQVIQLNSAANTVNHNIGDGYGTKKS